MVISKAEQRNLLSQARQLSSNDPDLLIRQHIQEDPYRPGTANARVALSGTPVWALIGYLPAVRNDLVRTADDYEVSPEAVAAAVHFYVRHKAIIDDRIEANSLKPGV